MRGIHPGQGKPALSVQEEDAMAQELGAAAVDEARAERSYDDVLQQLPGQQMVLTKLRVCVVCAQLSECVCGCVFERIEYHPLHLVV